MPRPNLFLIGSMKSGTTHLSLLLSDHPSVFMSSPKEPCRFVDGNVLRRTWPYMWRCGYWRGDDQYLSLFADAGEAPVIGEASTMYSHVPIFTGVPPRILAFSPGARFIYIMRDPIERSISHYWHSAHWWGERRSLLAAIRSDPQYSDVSHYARQLKEYLRYVGLERIYVLTYEELMADPANQLRQLYTWLRIDPTFRPARINAPAYGPSDVGYQPRGFGLLAKFRNTSTYVQMAPYLPLALRQLGTRLAIRSVRRADGTEADAQAYLRPRQLRETEELSALLNRGFPEWKTLHQRSERPPR